MGFSKSTRTARQGLAATLGIAGLALAGQAGASCMSNPAAPAKPSGDMRFTSALYRPDEARGAAFLRVSDAETAGAPIVGLWQFQFTGFSVDYGTQAWHSDGTETMFSGAQNPETGDFCQGVWRKVGPSTYTLNHIAMGWTAPGGSFGIRVHIHAQVVLDASGNSFSGKYTAAAYSVSPADPFDESVQLAKGSGSVSATRVTPD